MRLSSYTRACIYEAPGTGFSPSDPSTAPSYANDAAQIYQIYKSELKDTRRFRAIIIGHEAGHLSALAFRSLYESEFDSVIGISLTGVQCATSEPKLSLGPGTVIAPVVSVFSGAVRLVYHGVKPFLNADISNLDNVAERYLFAQYWKTVAERDEADLGRVPGVCDFNNPWLYVYASSVFDMDGNMAK